MTFLAWALLGTAWLVMFGAMGWVLLRRPYRLKRQVMVHTRDSRSLSGVLVATYPRALVLGHVRLMLEEAPGDEGAEMAGDVIVERANVSFVQVVA